MTDSNVINAEVREGAGKGASRRLRHQGKVPAIIYGAGRPPRALVFDHNRVLLKLENESFYSSILNIKVGEKSQAAILKDVQRHPARPQVMHMDFQRIVDDVEIKMNVPLHFIGEDAAPGIKTGGGSISRLLNDVEVSCLPKYLPEYLEVDISELELDEMLNLSDIKLPEGVEIPQLAPGIGNDQPMVSIHVIKEVVIEEEELEGEVAEAGEEGDAAGDESAAEASDGESSDE